MVRRLELRAEAPENFFSFQVGGVVTRVSGAICGSQVSTRRGDRLWLEELLAAGVQWSR
jgi:hypothetical protein